MSKGKVKCGDCQSSNIIFTNDDFNFDVSNKLVRDNIISSINEDIKIKNEIVEEFNSLITKDQEELNKLLETPSPDFRNYVLFESEIRNSSEIDYHITKLKLELAIVENRIKENESGIESNKDLQKTLLEKIIYEIGRLYKIIDPTGNMVISNLFTKANETFSGSEEQEFYFCKIVALSKILKHNYPLIIDSFREGELSTPKEEKMIDEFITLDKQVILTSTLKREEYSVDKYSNFKDINAIDYSQFQDSKLLQKDYVEDFKEILNTFPIIL